MPLLDQTRETTLIELAKTHFCPVLRKAEMRVLHDSASSESLISPKRGVKRPVVRPAFIRWLATDPEAASCIDPQGLRIVAATIPGKLDLRNCCVNSILDFQYCEFQGEINLQSAETRGIYIFDSSLSNGVCADRVIVHDPLFLRRIVSAGEIRLLGAEITGQLDCSGAKLRAKGNALSADNAKIGGNVFLVDGFKSDGAIRLLGTEITGQLSCNGAKLKANGNALNADGAKIGGGVFLIDGFESDGEIRLLGAEITGQLACNGAKLKATGDALSADNAKIGGCVFLTDGFESEGEIRLPGAEIGGDLSLRCAKVAGVLCQNMVVTGDLIWQRIDKSEKTGVNLIGAKVKNLRDDKDSWPAEGNLDLDGLVYEELTLHESLSDQEVKAGRSARELPLDAKERIAWLMRQHPERCTEPQPWMQLRDLLERKGDRKGAKHVFYSLRCLQAQNRWWLRRWWNYYFAWLEEEFLRICCSIAAFLLLGWLIFGFAGAKGAIAPTDAKAYTAVMANTPMPGAYPKLNPFVYTLENAVPLVKLGQDEKWAPDQRYPGTNWLTNYWFLMWSRWLLILSGWVQATVLVAALSERFKK